MMAKRIKITSIAQLEQIAARAPKAKQRRNILMAQYNIVNKNSQKTQQKV